MQFGACLRAGVVFAFFGYNESFAGEAGLPGRTVFIDQDADGARDPQPARRRDHRQQQSEQTDDDGERTGEHRMGRAPKRECHRKARGMGRGR